MFTTKKDYCQVFTEYNQRSEQQEMLSAISEVRNYTDNRRFNLAKAVQIFNSDILNCLLDNNTELKEMCRHKTTGRVIPLGKLFIPGFTPSKKLITYICYDIINQQSGILEGIHAPAYFCPESTGTWQKSSFVYAPPDSWDHIIRSDDVFVTDGVWDSVTMNMLGFPCVALLSSSLGAGAKRILKAFKRLYLVMDNDGAGSSLFNEMIREFPSVFRVVVPATVGKDVDNYVVIKGEQSLVSQIRLRTNTYLKGE